MSSHATPRLISGLLCKDEFDSRHAPNSHCAVRCAPGISLMVSGKSADVYDGCFCSRSDSFEFECAADGGAPIRDDAILLAGSDINEPIKYFSASELECWQL